MFALRNIDMTKIESRPMSSDPLVPDPSVASVAGKRFNNLFHIDFIANLAEQRAQNALRQLQVGPLHSFAAAGCVPEWMMLAYAASHSVSEVIRLKAPLLEPIACAGDCAVPARPGMLSNVYWPEDDIRASTRSLRPVGEERHACGLSANSCTPGLVIRQATWPHCPKQTLSILTHHLTCLK